MSGDERLGELAEELGRLAEEPGRPGALPAAPAADPDDPGAPAAVAEERRITRARRAVEKAAALLGDRSGEPDDT